MGTFFIYLIKTAVCLVFFYLFYKLLLSRDTFHRFNRIALLSLLLLSFVAPVVSLIFLQHPTGNIAVPQGLILAEIADVPQKEAVESTTVWILLPLVLYFLGVVFCLLRQLWSFGSLFRLMRNSRVEYRGNDYTLLVHNKNVAPFSWMKKVILSEKDLEENRDKILAHELAHICMRHSYDLMVADLCIFFQWFNPAAWLLKQELQSIHEFEADEVVLRQGIDAKQYQLLIIEKAVGTRLYSMANSFNHSSLKKRITMMLKEKSNPWARLKYLYVLPLTCVTVLAFTSPEVSGMEQRSMQKIDKSVALAKAINNNLAADKNSKNSLTDNQIAVKNDENLLAVNDKKTTSVKKFVKYAPPVITNSKKTVKFTPPVMVQEKEKAGKIAIGAVDVQDVKAGETTKKIETEPDELPQFPGGQEGLMKYLQETLYYPTEAIELGIQGKVIVKFMVYSTGKVGNIEIVSGVSRELDKEALRVIRLMPDWTPAKKNGKNCDVYYQLPINFALRK